MEQASIVTEPNGRPSSRETTFNDERSTMAPTSETDPTAVFELFPEGGLAGWCTVVGAALIQACGFGYITSYGVYQDYYTRIWLTNETPSAISWIGSINVFLVCAISPVAGVLCDRGYFYHMMICGTILQSISLFVLSLTQRGHLYQIILAQGFGLGIAEGLLYVPSITVVSHYFCRRRTLAMTLVACGAPIGAIVHPIMLNNLINGRLGFANGVRISAAFVTLMLLGACSLMRTRLAPPKTTIDYWVVAKNAARDVPFSIMTIAMLLAQFGTSYPCFFLQFDAVQHRNSPTFSFYSLAILNATNLVGRLCSGFITPYIGVPRLMIIASLACSVLIMGMIGLSSLASVVVLAVLFGFFFGIYIALMAPLTAVLTSDLSVLGERMGVAFLIAGIGSLLGSPVSSAILGPHYRFWAPAFFSGSVTLVGSLLFVIMHVLLARRNKATKHASPE